MTPDTETLMRWLDAASRKEFTREFTGKRTEDAIAGLGALYERNWLESLSVSRADRMRDGEVLTLFRYELSDSGRRALLAWRRRVGVPA